MRLSLILLLCLIIVSSASAELREVTTDIEMQVENMTVTVITEDKDYTFMCGPESTEPGKKTIKFYRDLACANQDELRTVASTLSSNLNNSMKYYDLYLGCYASEKVCQEKLSQNSGNSTNNYVDKYTQATEQLSECNSDKPALVTARQSAESKLSTCETEKKSNEDQKVTWGIGGAVLGALVYWFIFVKSKNKVAISSAEQQLPRSR